LAVSEGETTSIARSWRAVKIAGHRPATRQPFAPNNRDVRRPHGVRVTPDSEAGLGRANERDRVVAKEEAYVEEDLRRVGSVLVAWRGHRLQLSANELVPHVVIPHREQIRRSHQPRLDRH
jgi:hypothetical protein